MTRRWSAILGLLSFLLAPAAVAQNQNRFSAQPLAGNTLNATIGLTLFNNEAVASFAVSGLTASGGAVLTIEGSADAKNVTDATKTWFTLTGLTYACPTTSLTTPNADGQFKVDTASLTNVRLRVSTTGSSATPMLVSGNAIPGTTLSSCGAAEGSAVPTGTAGSANAAVISIQGIAGGTAVPVSGTFSATIGGFAQTPAYAARSVGASTARVVLPSGAVVVVENQGANAACVTFGDNTVVATSSGALCTNSERIEPNSWIARTIGTATNMAAIQTSAGPTDLLLSGGAGLPTGAGGGSAGSGTGVITGPLGHATADAAALSIVPSATASFPVTGTVTANAGTNLNTANIESYTSRLLSGSLPVAPGTATATTAQAVGGTYTAAGVTLTNGQQAGLQLTSTGALMSQLVAGAATVGKVDLLGNGGATMDVAQGGGTAATNALLAGAVYNTTPMTLTNGQAAALQFGDVAGDLNVKLNACASGVCNANGQATMANSSPVVLASNQSAIPVNPAAAATGGATAYQVIWPNNTTGVSIKGSAGTLYSLQLGGIGSAPAYVKLYDTASAPTCGSGTPKKRFIIPAASTAANGANSNITLGPAGVAFASGIGICVTTGIADNDTTAPAAATFLINIDYL